MAKMHDAGSTGFGYDHPSLSEKATPAMPMAREPEAAPKKGGKSDFAARMAAARAAKGKKK